MLDEQDHDAFLKSQYCITLPFVCMTRHKIDRFIMEVEYLDDIFDVTYRKFLMQLTILSITQAFRIKKNLLGNEDPQSLIKWDIINFMIMF